ncbi:MAG: hypothetical protein J3K34DRAFT_522201 [Monoraphidium minutum]|nr:MAG: hypothetical protein J3K34DRAFT_522201 [Monoraphidium minutum]
MPGVESDSLWHARIGEFQKYDGPSCGALESQGAILHLYRAARGAGPEGQPAVAQVRYFTAPTTAPGAASGGDPRLLPPSQRAGGGAGGAAMDVELPVIWDQERLGAAASTAFEFSLDNPVLKPDIDGAAPGEPGAAPPPRPPAATTRLLPLGGGALAIAALALPREWGAAAAEGAPPGSFWFLEVVLPHADAAGAPQLSTLSIAYDWSRGKLLQHRYYWQKGTGLIEQPASDGLGRVALRSVLAPPPRDDATDSVGALLRRGARGGSWERYSYAPKPPRALLRAAGSGRELPPPPPPPAGGSVAELVYGGGAACCRVPTDLGAAAAGAPEVTFGFFAADGPKGLVRCTIAYGGGGAGGGEGAAAALPLLRVEREAYPG